MSPDAPIEAFCEAGVINTEAKHEIAGDQKVSFQNPLKWLFASDNDELNRLINREGKKARRSSTASAGIQP